MMKPKVIVLGKNYSTPLGVIRSLGKAGYEVSMLYISRKVSEAAILKACKYLNKLVVVDEESDSKVFNALQAEFDGREKYVLFPTDDYSASFIDRFQSRLNENFIMPYVVGDSVTRLMDKSVQALLARDSGFQVAKGWTIDLHQTPPIIPLDIPYPCFVKPLVSAKGGKVGIAKCENRAELEAKIASMQRWNSDRSVIVQEFLHVVREYTIDGICRDQDIYIPALIQKTRIAKYNRGITLSGILVENQQIGDCYDLVIRYLKRVRYVGMFDFEILETNHGFFFGELNLRCGGPSYSYFLGGINLPELTVRILCGEALNISALPKIKLGKEFLNNKVAWEDYSDLYLSHRELDALFIGIPVTLLSNKGDPGPERVFNEIMPKQYYAHRRKVFIKKAIKRMIPQSFLNLYMKWKNQKRCRKEI